MQNDNLTQEEISHQYQMCLNCVSVINSEQSPDVSDFLWKEIIERNKQHLRRMLLETFWTSEDLTPLQQALNEGA